MKRERERKREREIEEEREREANNNWNERGNIEASNEIIKCVHSSHAENIAVITVYIHWQIHFKALIWPIPIFEQISFGLNTNVGLS